MEKPKTPESEISRLQELKSFAVLDTKNEAVFDQITQLASSICGTPMALVSLIDESRQWFKSKVGMEANETHRDISFCGHAINQETPFVVENTQEDQRFSDNPLVVDGPKIKFYAAVPLVTKQSHVIGTLCVLDTKPRTLSDEKMKALQALALQVMSHLEEKRSTQELKRRVIEACEVSELLTKRELNLHNFYEIVTQHQIGLEQKIENILKLGRDVLNLKCAMLIRIEDKSAHVENIVSEDLRFRKGMCVSLEETLCQHAIGKREPLCIEATPESEYRDSIAYSKYGVESYLGCCVYVNDTVYGTISFCDFDQKKRCFGREEKKVIQIMAQWLGMEISREKQMAEIEKQQKIIMHSSKMASLGEMAGSVAHEINNPLAMISGRSQILRSHLESGTMTDEIIRTSLDKIDSTVDRMLRVVRGLRSFSRNSEADEFCATGIKKIIEDTKDLCSVKFRDSGVDLIIRELPESEFECRPVQISQVLMNLLNNAVDAISEHPQKWVEVSCQLEKDEVVFRVRDSGLGIPADIQQKMMNPFFTTKGLGKGTGLGLSISLNIIQSHQGTLKIDNEDKNTSFVIRLPRLQNKKKIAV